MGVGGCLPLPALILPRVLQHGASSAIMGMQRFWLLPYRKMLSGRALDRGELRGAVSTACSWAAV